MIEFCDFYAKRLKRLRINGIIKQMFLGVYVYKRNIAIIGNSPKCDEVAGILCEKLGMHLLNLEEYAKYLLVGSGQAPKKDGRPRVTQIKSAARSLVGFEETVIRADEIAAEELKPFSYIVAGRGKFADIRIDLDKFRPTTSVKKITDILINI